MRGATDTLNNFPKVMQFQPTLPMRGATRRSPRCRPRCRYFNPRSPCGERPSRPGLPPKVWYFNPRSPCGERHLPAFARRMKRKFQPTLPMRGATCPPRPWATRTGYFNPRSPCGERPGSSCSLASRDTFQPTLPMRGATCCSLCAPLSA